MSDQPPNTGPSKETLRTLKSMLPSLKKGLEEGTLRGRGRPSLGKMPRKMCKVCGKLWDFVPVRDAEQHLVEADHCGPCQTKLAAGWIAIVWHDRYAFLEPKPNTEFAKYAGSILHVSDHVYQAIERDFKDLFQTKHTSAPNNGDNVQSN